MIIIVYYAAALIVGLILLGLAKLANKLDK